MIKAVIFDMFETLVTLFEGRTYWGENIAEDVGADIDGFRREWHAIEKDRSIGKYTIEEGLEVVLKKLGLYSPEKVDLAASKRIEALNDTFSNIPPETVELLKSLKNTFAQTILSREVMTESVANWLPLRLLFENNATNWKGTLSQIIANALMFVPIGLLLFLVLKRISLTILIAASYSILLEL